jgi:hypothetical protein
MPLLLPAFELRPCIRRYLLMELTQIADGDCGRDDCEGIFTTDRDTVVIRGDLFDMEAAPHEGVVEISMSLFLEAVRALGR